MNPNADRSADAAGPSGEPRPDAQKLRSYWGSPEDRHAVSPPVEPDDLHDEVHPVGPVITRFPLPLDASAVRSKTADWGQATGEAGTRPDVTEASLAGRIAASIPIPIAELTPSVGPSRTGGVVGSGLTRAPGSVGSLLGDIVGSIVLAIPAGAIAGLTSLVASLLLMGLSTRQERDWRMFMVLGYFVIFAAMGTVLGLMAPRAWPMAALVGWMPLWVLHLGFPALVVGQLPAAHADRQLILILLLAPLAAVIGSLLGGMGSIPLPERPPAD